MGAPAQINWTPVDVTARNAIVVAPLEIGLWCRVLDTGKMHQAIAAGSGASKWSQASDDSIAASDVSNDSNVAGSLASDALDNLAPQSRIYGPNNTLPIAAGLLLTDGVAYWVYVGYFPKAVTVKYIRAFCVTAGAGTQAAELALASGSAPSNASKSLTKIAATGAIADLTGTGLITNNSSFDQAIPAGTHLYAGIRTHMSVTQPTMYALGGALCGQVLTTAAAGALTGAGPWTGAVPTQVLTAMCPILTVTLD